MLRSEKEIRAEADRVSQMMCEEIECDLPGGPAGYFIEAIDQSLQWVLGNIDTPPTSME